MIPNYVALTLGTPLTLDLCFAEQSMMLMGRRLYIYSFAIGGDTGLTRRHLHAAYGRRLVEHHSTNSLKLANCPSIKHNRETR